MIPNMMLMVVVVNYHINDKCTREFQLVFDILIINMSLSHVVDTPCCGLCHRVTPVSN